MIHPTATVSPDASIGQNVRIWHNAQVREGAMIGDNTIIGGGVYIDLGVWVGPNCKVENGALIFHGTMIEGGVFIGPGAIICNDKTPRAILPNGIMKGDGDWTVSPVTIHHGASIGAGAIILPGVEIGEWAMIGAGAVVTKNVGDWELWYGNPARCMGSVYRDGTREEEEASCSPQSVLRVAGPDDWCGWCEGKHPHCHCNHTTEEVLAHLREVYGDALHWKKGEDQ